MYICVIVAEESLVLILSFLPSSLPLSLTAAQATGLQGAARVCLSPQAISRQPSSPRLPLQTEGAVRSTAWLPHPR